ncbi:MAG: hypothetical protein QOE90_1716 [Thermoplasmata archaeon]|nr:hypothetical protein [Thermoplasmata archaeon]
MRWMALLLLVPLVGCTGSSPTSTVQHAPTVVLDETYTFPPQATASESHTFTIPEGATRYDATVSIVQAYGTRLGAFSVTLQDAGTRRACSDQSFAQTGATWTTCQVGGAAQAGLGNLWYNGTGGQQVRVVITAT